MASFTFGYGGAYGYRGSLALAQILYQTQLGDFTYNTDASGNIVLTNQGSDGTSYDGLPYSSRFIELGALNDVDIPIHHTLGGNIQSGAIYTSGSATDTTISPVANGYNISHVYVSAPLPYIVVPGTTLVSNTKVLFTFTYTGISGTPPIFDRYFNGTSFVDITPSHQVVDGINTIELATSSSNVYVALDATSQITSFNGDFTFNTIKQITNPNSYLTYYDFTDGLVTLGNSVDGGSSENKAVNGDFSNGTTNWLGSVSEINGVGYYPVGDIGYEVSSGIGKRHQISVDVSEPVGATTVLYVRDGTYLAGTVLSSISCDSISTKTYTFEVVSSSNTLSILIRNTGTAGGTIDNLVIKEILPISTKYTLNTKTVNNFLTHTTQWSASDWTKINNNPNLVGKLALETLGATKTIPELDMVMDAGASADSYYMCSEKSGAYLVNSRVAYGAELVVNGTFDTGAGWGLQTGVTVSGGTLNIDGTQTINTYAFQGVATTIGSMYVVEFEVVSISAGNVRVGLGGSVTDRASSVGKYSYISTVSLDTTIYVGGDANFIGSLDNVSVREATATEIANYTSTVRTNADFQQKGIQTTAFVTDGAGVPTAYSDNLLQFNGDGRYVDTGWLPSASEDWSIEMVYYFNNITGYYQSGTYESVNSEVKIMELNGKAYCQVGNTNTASALIGNSGYIHCLVSYKSDGTYSFYVNNVVVVTDQVTTFTSVSTYPFSIGALNVNGTFLNSHISPIGTFKYHNKAMTATEASQAYAKAKAIYPTIP